MGKTLIVAECSDIIRKGLVNIISGFDLFDRIYEITCNSNIEISLGKFKPDVLIINPELVNPGFMKWLRKLNGDVKIAAVISNDTGIGNKGLYSEVFHTDDKKADIKKKIDKLAGRKPESRQEEAESILSPREKDVLRLLAKGLSNKAISEQLFISPHTVITHRKNITRKLNIRSVAGLLVYAIINEIVTVDEMQQE